MHFYKHLNASHFLHNGDIFISLPFEIGAGGKYLKLTAAADEQNPESIKCSVVREDKTDLLPVICVLKLIEAPEDAEFKRRFPDYISHRDKFAPVVKTIVLESIPTDENVALQVPIGS